MKIEEKTCRSGRIALLITTSLLILQFVLCASVLGQTNRENVDLIVSGATVVTMDANRAIYEDGSVAVKGDSIVAVGPRTEIESRYKAQQTIDGKGKLVLPGFVNGHTHVPMTLFRGLHDDVTLSDWLYKYIFPAEAKNVNEEFVRWGTRLAAAEQIRAGVTTFADMYYFEDAVAEETKAAGMRGIRGLGRRGGPAGRPRAGSAMRSPKVCSQMTLRPSSAASAKVAASAVMGMRRPGVERSV